MRFKIKSDITFLKYFTVFTILMICCASSGLAASNESGGAKITLVEENPYPAQIGEQMRILVQIENVRSTPIENASVQVVSEYPFFIDSSSSKRDLGTLYSGKKHYEEFYIMIDSSAPKGPRDLKIRQKSGNGNWVETRFPIHIGSNVFDSRGTLILEQVVCEPAAFMPGDRGQISIRLKNNATTPTIVLNKTEYDTNARIQTADLISTNEISVTSNMKNEIGIVSASDSKELLFDVKVPENMAPGTYYMTLQITGNSYEYNFKQDIAIKVDDSRVAVIQSKDPVPGANGTVIEFDIVNYRPNSIRGATIIPQKEGVRFYPHKYFIGEMKTDELYTAKFTMVTENSEKEENITIKAEYMNGDNKHTDMYDIFLSTKDRNWGPGIIQIVIGIAALLVILAVAAGGYLYYRNKKKKNQKQ